MSAADAQQGLPALLEKARQQVEEIEPRQAQKRLEQGWQLVDVREDQELRQCRIPGAWHCQRGMLEMRLPRQYADVSQPLLLICGSGARSLLAAGSLRELGYENVASVRGGVGAWREAGLPLDESADRDSTRDRITAALEERFARHLSLPEIGSEGQRRLLNSRVLIIGAGGLGCPVALYLAAAGVGVIGLADDDRIEVSNLQRQVLHSEYLRGELKTESARQRLKALNSDCDVVAHCVRVTGDNAGDLISSYDVVVDGSDNYATRYALNRACIDQQKPMVYAAVEGFQAQVSVFWPAAGADSPCYHCVFPETGDRPSCAEAGVLGAVPGLAGVLQAIEAIKLLLGQGRPLTGRLLRIDALAMDFSVSRLRADRQCPVCRPKTHAAGEA